MNKKIILLVISVWTVFILIAFYLLGWKIFFGVFSLLFADKLNEEYNKMLKKR